jgi:hypothetical protein
VTSVLGSGFEPTTAASVALGVKGFMKAALALRAGFFFAVCFPLVFAVFFVLFFVLVAIESPLPKRPGRLACAGKSCHLIPQGPRSHNSYPQITQITPITIDKKEAAEKPESFSF